ncbi:MAG: hypothetical protein RLZZ175_2948 [Bacteroidota bacterium]|jgi:CubicO group peptidase (beta-lactamase class C family)
MASETKLRIRRGLLVFFILANVLLLITNKTYIYKALWYNFANIDDNHIFEQRVIKASSHAQPWPVSAKYNKDNLSKSLAQFHKEQNSVAFVVIKNDTLYHEEYWDGYGDKSLSNSFSMGKSVISMLIGVAIKEGKIKSVDEPIKNYLPDFVDKQFDKITIKHLLTMSSGLNWDESYANPFSMTTEAYYGSDLWKLMLKLRYKEESGKYFKYLSGDTQLLSFILKKATGKSVSAYFQEKIWEPTGAVNNAEWSLDQAKGNEKAYCCVYSNAKDFARLGSLYLHNGNWKGKQIIDSAYVQASITPANLIDSETKKPNDFYGYQWWIIPDYKGQKVFYARGILGQSIIVLPKHNIVVVRLGNHKPEKENNHYKFVYQLIDEVLANVK